MKKLRFFPLLLALALVLTGCGRKESELPETAAPETAAAPETTEAATENLAMGTLEGGHYVNSYAGLGFDLDDGWVIRGADELQDLPEAVREAMDGSELAEKMEGVPQFTDFLAENADEMASINLVYTKQELGSRLAFQIMSDEEAVDATLSQQALMEEAYAQAGIEVVSMEKTPVKFLGRDTWALKTTAKIQDLDYYVLQVFNYKAGAYGLTLTCSTFVEDHTQELLELFYAAE